jgi:UTP--glucose-1-phosphate uridylyltransferase
MKKRPAYAVEIEGDYHDTGTKIGWLKANLAYALKREDMAREARNMIKSLR